MSHSQPVSYIFNRYDRDSVIAQIILGNLGGDQKLLLEQPEVAAAGIVDGIRCYFAKPWEKASPEELAQLISTPDTTNSYFSIGLIAGYQSEENKLGAICPDGTNESAVTLNIANLAKDQLEAQGYSVEVLDTLSKRTDGDTKAVIVALNTGECDSASGTTFIGLEPLRDPQDPEAKSSSLAKCLSQHYPEQTALPWLDRKQALDYAFNVYDQDFAITFVFLGSLGADKNILVNQPEIAAWGLSEGIKCYFAGPRTAYSTEGSPTGVRKNPTDPIWHGYLGMLYFDLRMYDMASIELGCAVDGCTTKTDTVNDAPDAPELDVMSLPLTDYSLKFYYTYNSLLAALATSQNTNCQRVTELNQQLQAFAPDNSTVINIVEQNTNICSRMQAEQIQPSPIGKGLPDCRSVSDDVSIIAEVEAVAGFDVVEPAFVPDGYTFQNAGYLSDIQTTMLCYKRLNDILYVFQTPVGSNAQPIDLNPDPLPEGTLAMEIGAAPALYSQGAYVYKNGERIFDATIANQGVVWESNQIMFRLSSTFSKATAQTILVKIVESMLAQTQK